MSVESRVRGIALAVITAGALAGCRSNVTIGFYNVSKGQIVIPDCDGTDYPYILDVKLKPKDKSEELRKEAEQRFQRRQDLSIEAYSSLR